MPSPKSLQPTTEQSAKPVDIDVSQILAFRSMGELGGTGTYIFRGFLSQTDYNSELSGRTRVDIYDQMWKGDATVRAAYLACILPILSANWYIQPASDAAKDKEVAAFVENQLFDNARSWTSHLREVMAYLRYGSYAFEKVFTLTDDGYVGWEKFAPRLPKTIFNWEVGEGDNRQFGIQQILPDNWRDRRRASRRL